MSQQERVLERLMRLDEPAPSWPLRRVPTLIVLVAVGAWVIYLTLCEVEPLSVWDLQDPQRLISWLLHVTVRYALHAAAFLALGMLLPGVVLRRCCKGIAGGHHEQNSSGGKMSQPLPQARRASWIRGLVQSLGDSVLAVGFLAFAVSLSAWLFGAMAFSWGLPFATEVAVGLCTLLFGAWIAFWWRCCRRRLVQQAVIVTIGVIALGFWGQRQVIQVEPFGFEAKPVSANDKRALLESMQRDSTTQDKYRTYRVSEDNLNKLLTWSLTFGKIEGKAKACFEPDTRDQQLLASVQFPFKSDPCTYLNVRAHGNCEILDEQLFLSLDSLQIGSLNVPGRVARWLGDLAKYWISSDGENLDLLVGIVHAAVRDEGVEVVISDDGIRTRRFAKVLRRLNKQPDLTEPVREHLNAFAEIARQSDGKEPLFDTIVKNAFHRAAEGSIAGNAVEQNRATILALGIALGYVKLERAVGDCWVDDARVYVYRLPRQCQLRERADWARHFWVSAALTLIAGDRVSDAAGLLKEELDSGDGGSGFSFGDLMADRAGTEFARAATGNQADARAIQGWVLDADTDLDELMPVADDLPEGLSELQMLEQYDGIDGKRYREKIDEMEQRLHTLPWRRK